MTASAQPQTILVVDDSAATLEVIQRNLASRGYVALTAPGVAEGIRILDTNRVDLVITDLKMPGASGLELVRHVRQNHRDTGVIMITGYASIDSAVSAVQEGADNYLAKPFTDEELLGAVTEALTKVRRRRATHAESPAPAISIGGLIGDSEVFRKALSLVPKAASSTATVLITGESGTGKELIARAIHYSSPRASAPFVPVNCGGIPEGLVESELFGHVKGAFTGAVTSRAGFFVTADGGTIFLDEISELTLPMQTKLLRVLQSNEVQMVGTSRPRTVDVRVIAATNKDLHHMVTKGTFREDLYFRLNVIQVLVPPLRDRGEDVLLMVRHFARKYAAENGRTVPTFSDRALAALRDYSWPGNVRELENIIQRLIVMGESSHIDVADLPSGMRYSALHSALLERTLADVEAEHIRNVLAGVRGNKTHAAKILGIDRKTLRQKLRQHDPSHEQHSERGELHPTGA
ncbi:MAG: sigma-54-dependent Fis family transcriptional regulator [Planctomycetota bacterium]|nr:MAG: sigma-54-dependent Fis family transcriptional regulator [Planctomycetota bacterium]